MATGSTITDTATPKRVNEVLICDCNSVEHNIVIMYVEEDDYFEDVYVNYHLAKLPFWDRVKYAWKYILGHQSDTGAFEEHVLSPTDETINKLNDVVGYLEEMRDKRDNEE